MSSREVMTRMVRRALVELVRAGLCADASAIAGARGLLAEAERARVDDELVGVLRSALGLVGDR